MSNKSKSKLANRITMDGCIHKAYKQMLHMTNPKYVDDQKIPLQILKNAKGLAFLTRIKAGFVNIYNIEILYIF